MLSNNIRETIKGLFKDQLRQLEAGDICLVETANVLFLDVLDRYTEHRIETDKVLIGIFKDIQNSVDTLSQTMECINNVGLVTHKSDDDDTKP